MHTIVRIKPQFDGHARQVMLKAFTSHFMYNKICIVVDEDVDIHDFADVWWAVLTRCRVDRELLVIPNLPGFFRDEEGIYRGRLGIDATKPFGHGHKFERTQVPGMNEINLKDYLV
jgi:4-hydroxybenzoate decarboxylase